MNIQKYLKKNQDKQIMKKTLFKSVFLIVDNVNINLEISKLHNIEEYYHYIQPLITFPSQKGFLLKNVFYFNLNNFDLSMDIVLIDNYFNVVECLQNIRKKNIIDGTSLKPYNILFLEENSINFFDIKVGKKIKLSKLNS